MTEITFVDHARPALPSGNYTVTATQLIAVDSNSYPATRTFTVSGDRFVLPPSRLTAVFPPDGSLGEYQNALPHVILDRPTLPWERSAGSPGADAPWLAVLLFTEAERPSPQVVRLGDLTAGPGFFPAITLERHQSPDDQATVIDVPRELLAGLLPVAAELPYLAHVRRSGQAPDAAVIIGSRLPPAGTPCTAHLVSLEGRYGTSGFDLGTAPLVRLVTLASWRFACLAAEQTFAPLVRDLAQDAGPYQLPDSGNADADRYLRQGFVPVRHLLRQGGNTISWYRGPFAPGPVTGAETLSTGTRSADHLLTFRPDTGMFDTGYAAAWELGRLLALQSTDFATTLYDWKRRRAQQFLRGQLGTAADFPLAVPAIDDAMPATVASWLAQLALLAGVPPMYLIPDDRLLPVETIRFVQVDATWIHCLLDGAFSIGRLSAADAKLDQEYPLDQVPIPVTGVLVRSDIISGYPGLLVDAFASADESAPLEPLRKELLSPSTLLCLFGGTVARLDIRQRPESLHFAVELPAEGQFSKTLRDAAGAPGPALRPLPLGPGGRLPVSELVAAMATTLGVPALGPGDFARQMIETSELVTFL